MKPVSIIFYADKNKLSSFGTQKGYPVVVRCANLPVQIRNSDGIGGGMIVAWLPIVSILIYAYICVRHSLSAGS